MLLRARLEPDATAALKQQLVRAGIGDEAPARGDDGARLGGKHALERAALEAAEGVLTVHGEDFSERRARLLLHLAIELDEEHVEQGGELRPERRFAGAAQADEGDWLLERFFLAHQSLHGDAHGARHLAQQQHRDVAAAGFELRQVALRDAGGERQRLAAHALLGAPGAHALAEASEIGVFLLLK